MNQIDEAENFKYLSKYQCDVQANETSEFVIWKYLDFLLHFFFHPNCKCVNEALHIQCRFISIQFNLISCIYRLTEWLRQIPCVYRLLSFSLSSLLHICGMWTAWTEYVDAESPFELDSSATLARYMLLLHDLNFDTGHSLVKFTRKKRFSPDEVEKWTLRNRKWIEIYAYWPRAHTNYHF